MALTKNVRAFINHVKGHCKEVGIKCDIRPVKYLVLSGNIRCSGYFCEETMKLVVAGKSKDWLGILTHEYAHLTQWQDKSTNIWKTGSTGVTHLDDWLGGKKIRSIKKAIEWSRDLELDNEKRAVKLIKKWNKSENNHTKWIIKRATRKISIDLGEVSSKIPWNEQNIPPVTKKLAGILKGKKEINPKKDISEYI
jgi:hypothetical protein